MSNKLSLLVNFVGVDKMSGALRNIIGLGKQGSRSLGEMTKEGRALSKELRDVRKEMAGSAQASLELAERERALEGAIARTNAEISERKRLYAIEADHRANIAKADALQQRGRDNMVQGATMAAPFILAMRAGMEYEKQLAMLAQKGDLSAQATQNLNRELQRIAQTNKQLPENILAGADFLSSQGLKGGQLIGLVDQASRFATAFNVDVTDASKAAHASLLSLKVPVDQVAEALQIMGVAGLEGGFEVRDMAQHFPALTAQFSTLGAEGLGAVASLSSALQVLQARTGDGAVAANNLQNLMRFVTTKQGQDNFKNFGINIVDELKKAEAEGGDALERLVELMNKATGGDQSKLAMLVSDSQAGKAALDLVTGIDQYRKMRDAAFRAQGVTAKEFERMTNTSASNWTSLQTSLSILSTTVGTHLLPLATQFANTVGGVVNSVGAWAQANPALASTLLQIVAGLAAFKIGLGATQFLLGGVLKPLAGVNAMVLRFAGSWSNAFAMMRTAAMALGSGMLKVGAMMLANPMVLIIAGIVAALAAAGYMIYTHWDNIKAAFQGGWSYVTSLLSGAANWLSNIGRQMMNGLLMAIDPMALGRKLITMAKNGITAFKNYLGIKSPSRVFIELGKDTAAGMAIGLERGERGVLGAAARMARGMVDAGSLPLVPDIGLRAVATEPQPVAAGAPPAALRPSIPLFSALAHDAFAGMASSLQRAEGGVLGAAGRMATGVVAASSLAAAPAIAGPAAGGVTSGSPMNVTINIQQQPGQNATDLALEVRRELERLSGQAARSSYSDG